MSFVDLAGSGEIILLIISLNILIERIAKSLTEDNKFKQAILINSSFSALNKVLLAVAAN